MTEVPVPAAGPIAAVLTDVDGTLITGAKVLTPQAIEAVGQLHERGALFAITSGRPPRGMRMLISPLKLQGPMAAFNGGIIVRPDLTVVEERTVAADVAPGVGHRRHPRPGLCTPGSTAARSGTSPIRTRRTSRANQSPSSSSRLWCPVTTGCWTGR